MKRSIVTAMTFAAALVIAPFASTPSAAPFFAAQDAKADAAAKDHIEYRLETSDVIGKYDIKVKVEGAHAWLSGDVRTAAQKTEAGNLAKVVGVTTVTNDIKVNPDIDKTIGERTKNGLNKAGEKITDAWITTKIHWFFTGEDLLKGSDINVDTVNGAVTLKGTVKSASGKARAEALAKRTDGVKSVSNTLAIK